MKKLTNTLVSSNEEIEEELEKAQLEDSVTEEKETAQDLAKEYVDLEREKTKIDEKLEDFKLEHQEIFDTIESILSEKKELEEQQNVIKTKLLDKITEKFELLGYSFVKVVTEVKRTFDSKKFYQDHLPTSRLYKKYVKESTVEPYVRITKLKGKKKDK